MSLSTTIINEKFVKYRLVLIRHGDSVWTTQNKFCGWYDSDLAVKGVEEAICAGKALRDASLTFDIAYTSVLKRAIKTLFYIQEELDLHWIPVFKSWRLNERMYGALQGLLKAETAAKYGEAQVKIWRRAYDVPPPPIDPNNPDIPTTSRKYAHLDKTILPKSECLKDTLTRLLPYWHDEIVPQIKQGKRVLIVAHGSTVRSIVKHLDKIPDDEIIEMNIPTGIPIVYELDEDLQPIHHYYLSDEMTVKKAIKAVIDQGKIQPNQQAYKNGVHENGFLTHENGIHSNGVHQNGIM